MPARSRRINVVVLSASTDTGVRDRILIRVDTPAANRKPRAATRSTHSFPKSSRTIHAGNNPTAPPKTAINERREFARTSSESVRTISGTMELRATAVALPATSRRKASGNSQRDCRSRAMNRHVAALITDVAVTTHRRLVPSRSTSGPMNGATTTNGARLMRRYCRTLDLAAPGSRSKNSEPASAREVAASAAAMHACAAPNRPKRELGSREST